MDSLGQPLWFGQYRLTSRIATGGMAEVYVGRHITPAGEFGPIVAIKRLLPHLIKDTQVVRMFLNEARITAQIHHPNVVAIVDLGQQDGEPFIAMELLDGRTFAELREKAAESGKRVPTRMMLRVLCEACRGLDAAHRATDEEGKPLKLVHRDFTPDNIHVGYRGDVKVIDFGVAKTSTWGAGTEPGTLKGKFFYMSPEMILAKPVDHRADVFAAGVMLYEQLCGHRPFTGTSVEEVVMAIAAGKPRSPRAYDPSVPSDLEEICLRALAHDVEQRFQSLEELTTALEAVGGEAQVATTEQLSEYLTGLFPPDKDPKRVTLKRAREADPSVPNARRLDDDKLASVAEATLRPQLEVVDEPQMHESPDAVTSIPRKVVPAPQRHLDGEPAPKKSRAWLGVVAVLVLGGGFGGWKLRSGSGLSPAEALTQASVAGAPRGKLLGPLAKDPATTDAQFEQAGKLLLEAKAWDVALELSEGWAQRAPKDPRVWMLEGRAASELRKGKRAESALQRADAMMPEDPAPNVALAALRELQGDPAGALEEYNRAVKKRPHAHELLARQGYLMSQTGRLDDAAKVLNQVLGKSFEPESAAELAFVRFRQNNATEADALLKRALKKAPQLMVAHYYLGAVQYQQGDAKAARQSYLEADRLAPDDPRALIALCEIEAATGAASLEETRTLISTRFKPIAAQLLTRCARAP